MSRRCEQEAGSPLQQRNTQMTRSSKLNPKICLERSPGGEEVSHRKGLTWEELLSWPLHHLQIVNHHETWSVASPCSVPGYGTAGLRKLSQTITTIRINQYLLRFLQDFPLLTALTGRAPKEVVYALFKTQK